MKIISFIKIFSTVSVMGFMAACATNRSEYTQPVINMPSAWQKLDTTIISTQMDAPWWRHFNDQQLNVLIEQALARNNDLAAAALSVRRAQLQAGLAVINPTFSLGINSSLSHHLSGTSATTKSQSMSTGVGYEIDLWGKLASQRDAARWEALATEEERESAALLLIGTTATLYWKIAYLNQRITFSEQSMTYVRQLLNLVKIQHDAGAASGLEVVQAEQSLATQEAGHTQLLQQRVEARNALAILFDGPPNATPEMATYNEPQTLPNQALPVVDAGLPMQLLSRRPDLKAAEHRLKKTLANVDTAQLSYYPTLSLTGSLGTSSNDLLAILKNPIATLGASLVFPFLQWDQMQLTTKVSEIDYQQAVINFRQKLYTALNDVENALSACTQYQMQASQLTQAAKVAHIAERLNEERYRAGAEPFKFLLDAQESRRSAEAALLDNHYNRLVNHVTLYQALGGDLRFE